MQVWKAAGALMITNMSFCFCGDAVVKAPMEAGRMFFSSRIDSLKMANFLVEK